MDREKLIRECLVLTCFLENINTNDNRTIDRLLEGLRSYSLEELNRYYTVNTDMREIRIDRVLKCGRFAI